MMNFNKDLLLKISDVCENSSINLIYLSSLAVYGIPKNKLVTNNSSRCPINFYGQTKNEADINLMNNNRNILIFNIIPSSIIVSNSKNGFYYKLKKLMRHRIIKIIFLILCPGGQFNFCTSEDIANEIKKSIKCSRKFNKKDYKKRIFYFESIISRGIKVREIFYDANYFYPLFTIPLINLTLIRIFFRFLNPNLLLRIIFLFSRVEYRNESDYLEN